jgi:hypothetical protein
LAAAVLVAHRPQAVVEALEQVVILLDGLIFQTQ